MVEVHRHEAAQVARFEALEVGRRARAPAGVEIEIQRELLRAVGDLVLVRS